MIVGTSIGTQDLRPPSQEMSLSEGWGYADD